MHLMTVSQTLIRLARGGQCTGFYSSLASLNYSGKTMIFKHNLEILVIIVKYLKYIKQLQPNSLSVIK
jgi:hypothetical protein